jgi:hypothetical protein
VFVRLDHVAGFIENANRTTGCDSLTLLVAAYDACATCEGFGFARNTATTLDVFYWLQVTNFDVLVLLNSAPNGPDYIDIWGLCLYANYFVAMFVLG